MFTIGHKEFTFREISSGVEKCTNKGTIVVNRIYQRQQTQKVVVIKAF